MTNEVNYNVRGLTINDVAFVQMLEAEGLPMAPFLAWVHTVVDGGILHLPAAELRAVLSAVVAVLNEVTLGICTNKVANDLVEYLREVDRS